MHHGLVSFQTVRISPYAIGAALVAATPSIVESFVPAPFAPAIEVAGALATAAIAAHAAKRAGGSTTWSDARTMLREVLPCAPRNEGGAALSVLRVGCGVERLRDALGRITVRKIRRLLGGVVANGARALVPGAGLVLQGVRAVTTALDTMAFVTTLEALARRSAELAETRAALRVVDFPGAAEPTIPAAA